MESESEAQPAYYGVSSTFLGCYDGGWIVQGHRYGGEFVVCYGVEVGDYGELFRMEG